MRDQLTRSKGFTRRAFILTGGKMLLMAGLTARLYQLQFMRSEEYKTLSDGNRIRIRPIVPFRGLILDRNGTPLAENQYQYRVVLDTDDESDGEDALQKLGGIIQLPEGTAQRVLQELDKRSAGPYVVKEHITWDELSLVELNTPDLPGIAVDTADIRYYPLGKGASHLIGYTGTPSEGDVEDNPVLAHPDFIVGKSGLERELEPRLRGKIGARRMEVNVHGLNVRELSVEESKPGENIVTTIDSRLQSFAAERIAHEGGVEESGGAVVVMDIHTGNILTLASTPGYDPNDFSKGITRDQWQTLLNHPDKPLLNKAIETQYPPGSTFKLITALAGLTAGTITPHTEFYCPGYYQLGKRRFHCWNEDGHGTLSLKMGLAQSCNVYFFNVAQRTGVDKIAEMAFKMGLGKTLDIGLRGEKAGIIPTRDWKWRIQGKEWAAGETLNMGIGQGFTLVTPLQLATMVSRYASGGKLVVPRLLKPAEEKDIVFPAVEGISQAHIDDIKEGMYAAINSPLGVAFNGRITNPKYAMSGKTGTAQVRSVRGMDDKVERKYRNHALFVGFAPVNEPRFAVSVLIEHGFSGGRAAVPVGRDVLAEVQRLADLDAAAEKATEEKSS